MRKPRSSAATFSVLKYGAELDVGLSQGPQTVPLADSFAPINARLGSCNQTRLQADRDQVQARVKVRYADHALDQTIRKMAHAAEIADGGRRGAISRTLFPEGITGLVVRTGEPQHAVALQLVTRLKACTAPGTEPVLGEWLPRIEQSTAELGAALQERARLANAYAIALAAEEAAREDHDRAIDKLMGEVRALFPKDRERWNLIFPEVASSQSRAEEETTTPEPAPESD
jgi:hypothetical protein